MPTDLDEQFIGEPVPGQDFTVNQEVAGITFHLVEQGDEAREGETSRQPWVYLQLAPPEVLRNLLAVHSPPQRKSLQSLRYRKGWDLSAREERSQPPS